MQNHATDAWGYRPTHTMSVGFRNRESCTRRFLYCRFRTRSHRVHRHRDHRRILLRRTCCVGAYCKDRCQRTDKERVLRSEVEVY